jgi:hypothetical protein
MGLVFSKRIREKGKGKGRRKKKTTLKGQLLYFV